MMCKCEHPRAMHDSRGCPLFRCDCAAFDEETNVFLAYESDAAFYYQTKAYNRVGLEKLRNELEANT